jgi:type III secretion protein J
MPVSDLVPQIKLLVANAVAGLSYDKVSVILVPVAARTIVARNDRGDEFQARGRGDGLFVADWPTLSLGALAIALVAALAFAWWRQGPRVYQLDPTDAGKS